MSVGEALVHGLLGGTIQTSEHIVTDWKDRVTRARNQAELEEQRAYEAEVRKDEWEQRNLEAEREQAFRTQERLAGEKFQAGENKLTREQQTQERLGTQEFTISERDQDVIRKQNAYEATLKLDRQYREPGTQFTWDASGENLIPVKPGENPFAPPVAEINKNGEFSWFASGTGSGTSRKGLLSQSVSGSGGKAGDSWTTIEIPTGGPLGGSEKQSIYTDTNGKQYQVVPDGQGGTMAIPFNILQEAPAFVTPEQQIAADQFAKNTVNDLAHTLRSDATDFADWGGSREAAKEYFRQNYLQGNQLDESGRLRLPTTTVPPPQTQPTPQQAPAQKPVTQTNDRTNAFIKMYDALSVNQQDILQQAMKAIQVDNRDPVIVRQRLLDNGFTAEQLSYLF